jgi:hypothetical protein
MPSHDEQHSALSTVQSQALDTIHWHVPVDLSPPQGEITIHYGSPLVTAANTVIVQRTAGKISRFNETGVVDSSFSSMKFTFGNQQRNEPTTMALQSNGQIVVGSLFGLARLNSGGGLDTAFWRRLTCYLRDYRRADPEEWQDRRRRKSSKQPNGHHDPNAGAYLAK